MDRLASLARRGRRQCAGTPDNACVRRILDRWEGQFVLFGPFPDGTAVARFSQPAAQKEVCTLDPLTWSPQVILEAVSDDSMKGTIYDASNGSSAY